MAATVVMAVSGMLIVWRTAWPDMLSGETIPADILPILVLVVVGFLVAFGLLLKPPGFLIASIKLLARKGWGYTLAVSLGSLLAIWIVFRVVFTALLPSGIVPEAEFLQMPRDLVQGGA